MYSGGGKKISDKGGGKIKSGRQKRGTDGGMIQTDDGDGLRENLRPLRLMVLEGEGLLQLFLLLNLLLLFFYFLFLYF